MDQDAQDESQFESGYNAEPTETPVKAETTPEPVAPVVEEKPDLVSELRARLDKFEASHNTLAGHIGGLNRSQKELNQRFESALAATKAVGDAPSKTEVQQAINNPAEWEVLKAGYPEWALATEKFMDARLQSVQPGISPDAIAKIVNEQVVGQTAAVRKEIIDASLDAVFPSWQDDVKTEKFGKWLQSQPDEIKALGASSNVRDAAKMLKTYYEHKPKTSPAAAPAAPEVSARQKRIEAAVTPRGTGGHAPSRSDLDEFEAGYSS